jgi:two-component system, NtrC family, sensor kinase
MTRTPGSPRLRVAVFGLNGGEGRWAAALAGRTVDVKVVPDTESALAPDLDLAVIFGSPEEGADVARAAAGRPEAPALALIVGAPAELHPHGRFLEVLLDAKNAWEGTFDAIVDPVVLLDAEGRVERANRAMARALGRPIEQTVGASFADLVGPALAPADAARSAADPVAESRSDGRPHTGEVRYERLDGIQEVSTSPLGGEDGSRAGLIVSLKDVTQRNEHQDRMLRTSRLADIGQLAAGVAHEINTPLASIALRAESLLKASQDPRLQSVEGFEKFPRYLKTIDEEIFRCKKIIGSLLDFSRVRKPEVRETDLNALAVAAADLVRHQMKLKQVTLDVRVDPSLPHIPADDGQLRQALLALLMNALDATPAGGRVEVETRPEEPDHVTLSVRDTGSGIRPEHRDKIFSPFFTTKPVGQGTGLGLAICHGIVASHGGEIRVESEVDKGTCLTLVLPRSAAAGPAEGR